MVLCILNKEKKPNACWIKYYKVSVFSGDPAILRLNEKGNLKNYKNKLLNEKGKLKNYKNQVLDTRWILDTRMDVIRII